MSRLPTMNTQAPGEPETHDASPRVGNIEYHPPAVEALEDMLKRALKPEGSIYSTSHSATRRRVQYLRGDGGGRTSTGAASPSAR